MSEVIDTELGFEPVLGAPFGRRHEASVVDEDVDGGVALRDRCGCRLCTEASEARSSSTISSEASGWASRISSWAAVSAFARVPGCHDHLGAGTGQGLGGIQAEAAGGSGDDGRPCRTRSGMSGWVPGHEFLCESNVRSL